ncbi:uncharacterized protein [Haliotis asinina]|uniref:uncharacterized protein n=1 Tax=Haliotis asinina TaxID=109174 RepID=UPI00353221A7
MSPFGQGRTSINCPDISYLGVSTDITCITSVGFTILQYRSSGGGVFPQCSASSSCTPVKGYTARSHNTTYSTLTVLNVQPTHRGKWTCADAGSRSEASCSLFITNVPRCHIRSDQNTDSLALHEELSLTVDIQEYYCSTQYTFTLLVGDDNVQLPLSEPVTTSTSTTANTSVNITASSLGGVRLAFLCHSEQQILSCDGVKFLNVAPRCSITSSKTIETVVLYEKLDLSVDIQNYFCSSANNFTLQVGKVNKGLFAAASGNRLRDMTVNITVNITDLHFGDMRLIFLCQDHKQILTCDGLKSIQGTSVPTTLFTRSTGMTAKPSSESNLGIIAAVVSFTGIVVVSLIVIVCCYRHRRNQTITSHSPSPEQTVNNPVYNAAGSKQIVV